MIDGDYMNLVHATARRIVPSLDVEAIAQEALVIAIERGNRRRDAGRLVVDAIRRLYGRKGAGQKMVALTGDEVGGLAWAGARGDRRRLTDADRETRTQLQEWRALSVEERQSRIIESYRATLTSCPGIEGKAKGGHRFSRGRVRSLRRRRAELAEEPAEVGGGDRAAAVEVGAPEIGRLRARDGVEGRRRSGDGECASVARQARALADAGDEPDLVGAGREVGRDRAGGADGAGRRVPRAPGVAADVERLVGADLAAVLEPDGHGLRPRGRAEGGVEQDGDEQRAGRREELPEFTSASHTLPPRS